MKKAAIIAALAHLVAGYLGCENHGGDSQDSIRGPAPSEENELAQFARLLFGERVPGTGALQ